MAGMVGVESLQPSVPKPCPGLGTLSACSSSQPEVLTSPQRPTLATPQWTSPWP